jgi:hypothetical protein
MCQSTNHVSWSRFSFVGLVNPLFSLGHLPLLVSLPHQPRNFGREPNVFLAPGPSASTTRIFLHSRARQKTPSAESSVNPWLHAAVLHNPCQPRDNSVDVAAHSSTTAPLSCFTRPISINNRNIPLLRAIIHRVSGVQRLPGLALSFFTSLPTPPISSPDP